MSAIAIVLSCIGCFILGFVICFAVMMDRINKLEDACEHLDGSLVIASDEQMPYFCMNDDMDKLQNEQVIMLRVVKEINENLMKEETK